MTLDDDECLGACHICGRGPCVHGSTSAMTAGELRRAGEQRRREVAEIWYGYTPDHDDLDDKREWRW